jgi:tRNA-dihydrouridine synthase
MRLGPLTLAYNLFLSPLAGYTNLPFRLTVRELGGIGLATTDLVNARSLLEKKAPALKLIETSPADRPLAVQLFGSVPEEMRDAAAYLESLGVASADINMGCPVRKVCRVGGGSAMMTELDKTAPVIGNGDVTTPEAAKVMIEQTGCAGVSIGRGAFYNPWIFHHTQHYLKTGELLPEPTFEERVRVMCRHLDLMIEVFGEAHGCRMFRKVAPWYGRRFGPVNEFNKHVVLVSTRAEFLDVLARYRCWREPFLDPDGELKPRFRPPPMTASFMQAPGAAPQRHIPVPKGPVEVW